MDKLNEFPKTIWFLWLQGIETAPFVVKKCYESWTRHNPTWKVVFLEESNLADFIIIKHPDIAPQAQSDIIRINLLATYGGIWVDATCFCVRPLDSWIGEYMATGFFAFNKPGPDRMIASWFLACHQKNYLACAYKNEVNKYWEINKKLYLIENSRWKFLGKYLAKKDSNIWFGLFTRRILHVYPYFWFHYLFEKMYRNDNKVKEKWDDTKKTSADLPHALQFSGLLSPLTASVKADIDDKVSPVYKLVWRCEINDDKGKTILGYLLNTLP